MGWEKRRCGGERGEKRHEEPEGSGVGRASFMMGVWRLKGVGGVAMKARAELIDRTGFQRMGKGSGGG